MLGASLKQLGQGRMGAGASWKWVAAILSEMRSVARKGERGWGYLYYLGAPQGRRWVTERQRAVAVVCELFGMRMATGHACNGVAQSTEIASFTRNYSARQRHDFYTEQHSTLTATGKRIASLSVMERWCTMVLPLGRVTKSARTGPTHLTSMLCKHYKNKQVLNGGKGK